ncbi:MAG: GNAT family N-acetyltransferase [candidate division Zixibacteria bacterium]|nr:GNAT family N-acetyltransferase [candidate division Zixibacteria bacterium]
MAYLIKAGRVNLRTVRKADAESMYRYLQDGEIGRWTLIPRPYRRKDAQAFIEVAQRQARKKKPNMILLGIEYPETGEIIGGIGLHQINYQHKNAEIGCWIGKPFRGQGLVTEAMKALMQYAFKTMKLKRVSAQVFVGNVASMKMVRRCGFTREGCLRSNFLQRGEWRTSYIYSILSEELKNRQVILGNPPYPKTALRRGNSAAILRLIYI